MQADWAADGGGWPVKPKLGRCDLADGTTNCSAEMGRASCGRQAERCMELLP